MEHPETVLGSRRIPDDTAALNLQNAFEEMYAVSDDKRGRFTRRFGQVARGLFAKPQYI